MNRTLRKRRFVYAVCLAFASVTAFAFIPEKPKGFTPQAEQTQEQLASQQSKNGTTPIVGSVELSGKKTAKEKPGDSDAMAASALTVMADPQKAFDTLRQVEVEKQMAATKPVRNFIWGGVVILLGLGLAFVIKFLADKSMPQLPAKKGVRW